MIQKKYNVLRHEVEYTVTSSSQEFNSLDPKRPDAANDEAVNNIVYRSMNPDTRYWFLHGISDEEVKKLAEKNITAEAWIGVEEDSGVARKTEDVKGKDGKIRLKDGEPVTRFTESEEVYYNRAIATLVEEKKFASEDAVRAHYDPIIKRIASYVPFDVAAPERVERGPKKLAQKYKLTAAKAITLGRIDSINANQLSKIGKTFTPTNDTSKVFEGTFEDSTGATVSFKVSDADAETLGWLIKEYFDWKASQEMLSL